MIHLKNANTRSQKATPDQRLVWMPPPEGRQLALGLAADSDNRNLVMYMFKIKSHMSRVIYRHLARSEKHEFKMQIFLKYQRLNCLTVSKPQQEPQTSGAGAAQGYSVSAREE